MNFIYILLSNCFDKKYLIYIYINEDKNNNLEKKNDDINKMKINNNYSPLPKINENNINEKIYNIVCYQCNSIISSNKDIYCIYDKNFCTTTCRNIFYSKNIK